MACAKFSRRRPFKHKYHQFDEFREFPLCDLGDPNVADGAG